MFKPLSTELVCRNLLELCDSSFAGLIVKFESLSSDAQPLILGYLDSILALINRTSCFIVQIGLNPNFS